MKRQGGKCARKCRACEGKKNTQLGRNAGILPTKFLIEKLFNNFINLYFKKKFATIPEQSTAVAWHRKPINSLDST